MQVILFENIDKLGMQGDVVNVAKGYFRNFLGPRGIAVEASEANLKRLTMKRKKLMAEAEKQRDAARALADRISAAEVSFTMKSPDGKKLFGSVHDHDIIAQLTEQGFQIERRQVALPEPIKTVGVHEVRIKLVGHVEAPVKVQVTAEGVPAEVAEILAAESAEAESAESAESEEAKPAEATAADEVKSSESAEVSEDEKKIDASAKSDSSDATD